MNTRLFGAFLKGVSENLSRQSLTHDEQRTAFNAGFDVVTDTLIEQYRERLIRERDNTINATFGIVEPSYVPEPACERCKRSQRFCKCEYFVPIRQLG